MCEERMLLCGFIRARDRREGTSKTKGGKGLK